LNVKSILTFSDAHITSIHTTGSSSSGSGLMEIITVNYSKLMIRINGNRTPVSQGYDFKKAAIL
jgi:type VI protein secretion system component Hcp